MGGYLRSFKPTGNAAVDAILDALRNAGDSFHHTIEWGDPDHGTPTHIEKIQAAADSAARGTGTRALKGREEIADCIEDALLVTIPDDSMPDRIDIERAADAILARGIADEAGEVVVGRGEIVTDQLGAVTFTPYIDWDAIAARFDGQRVEVVVRKA